MASETRRGRQMLVGILAAHLTACAWTYFRFDGAFVQKLLWALLPSVMCLLAMRGWPWARWVLVGLFAIIAVRHVFAAAAWAGLTASESEGVAWERVLTPAVLAVGYAVAVFALARAASVRAAVAPRRRPHAEPGTAPNPAPTELTVQLRCVVNITGDLTYGFTTHYKTCNIRLDAPAEGSAVRELACPLCGRKFKATVVSAKENVVKRVIGVVIGLAVLGFILLSMRGIVDSAEANRAGGDFNIPLVLVGGALLIGVAVVSYVRSASASASFLEKIDGMYDHELHPVAAR